MALLDRKAGAAGVRPGMRRGGVLTLVPDIELHERDMGREEETLHEVVVALMRFSPDVAVAAEATVLMDISASRGSLAASRCSVLRALEDVSDSLTAYNEERIRAGKLLEQSQQSKRAADLACVRYLEVATDFLELLDAERTQLAAEDDLAEAEVAINTDTVAIYKEIGGGWEACGDDSCSQVARGSPE